MNEYIRLKYLDEGLSIDNIMSCGSKNELVVCLFLYSRFPRVFLYHQRVFYACLALIGWVSCRRSLNQLLFSATMSDSEEITRKLPTGEKIVEKVSNATLTPEGGTSDITTEHVEKKRMTADGNIKYSNPN